MPVLPQILVFVLFVEIVLLKELRFVMMGILIMEMDAVIFVPLNLFVETEFFKKMKHVMMLSLMDLVV